MPVLRCLGLACAVILCAACTSHDPDPRYISEGNPKRLADWGQFSTANDAFTLAENVLAYDLATPLFTDYAHKLRTVWMPQGLSADYRQGDTLAFPVGTVITKTFYYPLKSKTSASVLKMDDTSAALLKGELRLSQVRLIETRVLVHRNEGWVAIPYRWNDEQTEALLHRTGDIIPLTLDDGFGEQTAFNYVMPNVNQCAGCHAIDSNNRALKPIGPKVRHLNKPYSYASFPENQLQHMITTGRLIKAPAPSQWPKNASSFAAEESVDARARSYLDINCSHCHSEVGPADTSGLHLETHTPYGPSLGICKLAIAAGRGTGNRKHDIVPGQPQQSILVYRMQSVEADVMMPEIGRSLAHTEGVTLVSEWILSQDGHCG